MANEYKSNGTTVFSYSTSQPVGSRVTFSDAEGTYRDFHAYRGTSIPDSVSGTAVIDFSLAVDKVVLTAATTFSESNKATGRSTYFQMRRSTYAPTFSNSILWQNGIEPTWSDSADWGISMICLDSTLVLATAQPFSSSA